MSAVFSLQVFAINKPCFARDPNRTNTVSVLYTTDDGYFAPTIVSMQSALQSMDKDTFYDFHLMVNGEFSKTNDLEYFKIKNEDKCSITTHNMGDDFKGDWLGNDRRWSAPMYYRLKAASTLNDINKCIYIDGNTIVTKDLYNFFNIDLEDNYLGGTLDSQTTREISGTEIYNNYINSGSLLINLKKIRDDSKEKNLLDKVEENNREKKYPYPDQDILNAVFNNNIKLLPLEYNFMSHLFMYETRCIPEGETYSKQQSKIETNCFEINDQRTESYIASALEIKNIPDNYPTVVHFTCNKPWKADCGVNNKGKNRKVWEPLYQKWHETADYVKKYGIFIENKSGLFSNPYVKWGAIAGGSMLAASAIVGAGIAIKKK